MPTTKSRSYIKNTGKKQKYQMNSGKLKNLTENHHQQNVIYVYMKNYIYIRTGVQRR